MPGTVLNALHAVTHRLQLHELSAVNRPRAGDEGAGPGFRVQNPGRKQSLALPHCTRPFERHNTGPRVKVGITIYGKNNGFLNKYQG